MYIAFDDKHNCQPYSAGIRSSQLRQYRQACAVTTYGGIGNMYSIIIVIMAAHYDVLVCLSSKNLSNTNSAPRCAMDVDSCGVSMKNDIPVIMT